MNRSRPPPFLCAIGALSLGGGMVWVSDLFLFFGGGSGLRVKGREKASPAPPGCKGVAQHTALQSLWLSQSTSLAVPLRCELGTPPRLQPPLRAVQPDRDKGGILTSTLKSGATLKSVEFSTLTQKPLNKNCPGGVDTEAICRWQKVGTLEEKQHGPKHDSQKPHSKTSPFRLPFVSFLQKSCT